MDNKGIKGPFSTHCVWNNIRDSRMTVGWSNSVWFGDNIASHAFILWLVIIDKLKTWDKMKKWGKKMDWFVFFAKIKKIR